MHTYHCVPFTGECHGTAAYKAQTTSIYDVMGHRYILFYHGFELKAFEGRHFRIINMFKSSSEFITHRHISVHTWGALQNVI